VRPMATLNTSMPVSRCGDCVCVCVSSPLRLQAIEEEQAAAEEVKMETDAKDEVNHKTCALLCMRGHLWSAQFQMQ